MSGGKVNPGDQEEVDWRGVKSNVDAVLGATQRLTASKLSESLQEAQKRFFGVQQQYSTAEILK